MRISLRYKAALLIAITQILLLGLLLISNLHSMRKEFEQQLLAQAEATGQLVAASATEALLAVDINQLHKLAHSIIDKHNIKYVAITNHNGVILAEAGEQADATNTIRSSRGIYLAGTLFGKVTLDISRTSTDFTLKNITHSNLLIVSLAVMLVALISLTLGWFLTRNLKALARGAQNVARGNYNVRMALNSNDEIGDLSQRFNEMTAQLQNKQLQLRDGNKRLRDLADNTSDWLWETDLQGRYTYASKQVHSLLGYRVDQIIGTLAFDLMAQEDGHQLRRCFERMKRTREPIYGFEYRATRKGGDAVNFELNATPVVDHNGKPRGFRGVTRDITRRKEDESKLAYLAEHDPLTGLYDRQKFIDLLDREIDLSLQAGTQVSILLIDLNGFKLVNDTHGYMAGDTLLRIIADLLMTQLDEGGQLARLGGDEFGIIVHGDSQQAKTLAKKIINTIETTPLGIAETAVRVFAGIGICSYPQDGRDSETLLAHAHSAVTNAKSLGHNRYHIYQPSDTLLESMRMTINWQTLIQDALENERLFLDFQPIAPMPHNRERTYYEALLRLKDERGEVYTASQFIDTAEHTGQVSEIDKWVLKTVLHKLHTTRHDSSCIALNLSGRSLRIPDYCDYFQQQVSDSGINPKRIIFEITETAAVLEIAKAESFLTRMKKLGYKFALDDFGAGFSSFSYLKHLPVDQIKIDGSFIQNLDQSREDQIFVRAIVQIAHELGLETVAEYVQSQGVLDILMDIGVDYVQGNHISRPQSHLGSSAIEFSQQLAYKLPG